jgi:hypothetical protein
LCRCADPALQSMGRVMACDDALVRLQVPRRDVAATAGALLERYPVADITIEEEDVGTIIEQIMRAKSGGADR